MNRILAEEPRVHHWMQVSSWAGEDGYFRYTGTMKAAGFEEVAHTADWSLRVWAPDLPALMEQAAVGMCSLLGMELAKGGIVHRTLKLKAEGAEMLLVDFLNEILYLAEREGIGFRSFPVNVKDHQLRADLEGAKIQAQQKEIKAVTYNQLEITETGRGLETTLVFDV